MPNITYSTATFTGPYEDLVKLHRLLNEADPCNLLLPTPPFTEGGKSWYGDADKQAVLQAQYNLLKKAYGYESDYDFVNDVWGSKWGITNIEFDETLAPGATRLYARWESAWSPAYGLIYTLARLFPTIEVDTSHEDECSCYERHDIVLKNPQDLADLIVFGITKKPRGYLQSDGFIDIVNHNDDDKQYAYLIQYDVKQPDDGEDGDEEVTEKPREKIPQHIGLTFIKAEAYLNGYLSGTAHAVMHGPQLDALKLWKPSK